MSFHPEKEKKIRKILSGQDIPQTAGNGQDERMCLLSPAVRKKASLTIEAALVLPLFLFFLTCMIHFLLLISLQTDIQVHIDETARSTSKRAYIADEMEITSVISSNFMTLKALILDESLSERINRSQIPGGTGGFHTFLSSYDEESGELDVVATYSYVFPYIPSRIGTLNFYQRCFCRSWIGSSIAREETDAENTESNGRTVYITPTGKAWHKTPSCHYLDLSIRPVPYSQVDTLRNTSGSRYGRCRCFTDPAITVYITNYGTLYHSDRDCSSLKRTVMEVDISEVGSRHPCRKCAAGSTGGEQ